MVGDRALARGTSVALFASSGLAIHKSITPENVGVGLLDDGMGSRGTLAAYTGVGDRSRRPTPSSNGSTFARMTHSANTLYYDEARPLMNVERPLVERYVMLKPLFRAR